MQELTIQQTHHVTAAGNALTEGCAFAGSAVIGATTAAVMLKQLAGTGTTDIPIATLTGGLITSGGPIAAWIIVATFAVTFGLVGHRLVAD